MRNNKEEITISKEKIDYYDEKIKNVEYYIKDKSDFFDDFDLFS